MSVLVPRETRAVKAIVRFAEYTPDTVKPEGRGRGKRVWKRRPRQTIAAEVPLDAQILQKGIRLQDTVGIDHEYALITSANFTDRGQTRNIEAGVAIEDRAFAASLERQWLNLVDAGVVVRA
ncbi:hypothetical protein [Sorangium sp. So ce854]|uniref:hypothetical protein n=1 Tax=Sorangium sp. So ce854 TaxID=3133322 RepID=UPI003F629568